MKAAETTCLGILTSKLPLPPIRLAMSAGPLATLLGNTFSIRSATV